MLWIWLGIPLGLLLASILGLYGFYWYLRIYYGPYLVRGFQEVPLFIIPRGQPIEGVEEVRFPTTHGLQLQGCYFRARTKQRRGVILFGLEFRSNRWSCVQYCEHLLEAGFDVFTFETRNQGNSDAKPDYEPLQWLTSFEVEDTNAAIAYLKTRPDADPRGVGFFGISKGGNAGLMAGATDPYLRCFVTDGVFATWTVVVPYMRKWIGIYSKQAWLQTAVPAWFYEIVGRRCLNRNMRAMGCSFPDLEKPMKRLAPRPLLMIHGSEDSYIKPDMAKALFGRARAPKEFWLVAGAKHNQALHVAGDEYRRRVCEFFQKHLAHGDSAEQNEEWKDETERRTDEEPPPHEIALSSSQEAASPRR